MLKDAHLQSGPRTTGTFAINNVKTEASGNILKMATAAPKEIILEGGFEPIKSPDFRPNVQKEGKAILDHIFNVTETRRGDKITITAKCLRSTSINESPYILDFELDQNRNITSSHCSCVAGISATCRHSWALIHVINHERSEGCTDAGMKWKNPLNKRQHLYPKGETLQSLFHLEPVNRPNPQHDKAKMKSLAETFEKFGLQNSSLYKSATSEPKKVVNKSPATIVSREVAEMLQHYNGKSYGSSTARITILDQQQKSFYNDKVMCNNKDRYEIFLRTLGQDKNPAWFLERKTRISASRAHSIRRARKLKTKLNYFFKESISHKNLVYGQATEPEAIKKYSEVTGNQVLPSGLIVMPQHPWLAATPDGLVVCLGQKPFPLEIKCPISNKDSTINVEYLQDGKLKRSHPHYCQVQLQILACNAEFCHFLYILQQIMFF